MRKVHYTSHKGLIHTPLTEEMDRPICVIKTCIAPQALRFVTMDTHIRGLSIPNAKVSIM